jgi:hypothetical protein
MHQVRRAATKRAVLRWQVSAYGGAISGSSSDLLARTPCAESTASLEPALRRKTTGLGLFARPPPQPRPALQKNQLPAPAPPSLARQNALRAKKQLRGHPVARGGPGVPRKWCYWDIFAPFHRQHPSGSLRSRGAHRHRGAARAPPHPKPPPFGASNAHVQSRLAPTACVDRHRALSCKLQGPLHPRCGAVLTNTHAHTHLLWDADAPRGHGRGTR